MAERCGHHFQGVTVFGIAIYSQTRSSKLVAKAIRPRCAADL